MLWDLQSQQLNRKPESSHRTIKKKTNKKKQLDTLLYVKLAHCSITVHSTDSLSSTASWRVKTEKREQNKAENSKIWYLYPDVMNTQHYFEHYYAERWSIRPLDCQILPEVLTGKKKKELLLETFRKCICRLVLFACVCLRFQGGRLTMRGSVPCPLQCLIGQKPQSDHALVVPTMRPCVAWARVWGSQRETTTRCSTSLQQQISGRRRLTPDSSGRQRKLGITDSIEDWTFKLTRILPQIKLLRFKPKSSPLAAAEVCKKWSITRCPPPRPHGAPVSLSRCASVCLAPSSTKHRLKD